MCILYCNTLELEYITLHTTHTAPKKPSCISILSVAKSFKQIWHCIGLLFCAKNNITLDIRATHFLIITNFC